MIVSGQGFHAVGCTVYGSIRDTLQQLGYSPAVIDLSMIGYEKVYLFEIYLRGQVAHVFCGKGSPNRVYKSGFLFLDQVGVVGLAPMG